FLSGKPAVLSEPPRSYRLGKIAFEICEVQKGLPAAELLAHEQRRHRRCKQHHARHGAQRLRVRESQQTLAEGAVADLVVVLQERDERGQRNFSSRLPPSTITVAGSLALISEAFA